MRFSKEKSVYNFTTFHIKKIFLRKNERRNKHDSNYKDAITANKR